MKIIMDTLKRTLVKDVMSTNLITINPLNSMNDVKKIIETHNIHHIPVLDETKKLIGMISRQDLDTLHSWTRNSGQLSAQLREKKLLESVLAQDMMKKNLVTIQPEEKLEICAKIFSSNKIHALPVVKDESLIGIITTYDLIYFAYN